MVLLTIGSTTLLVLWLVVVHDLWVRPSSRAAREQAVLFNAATTTTIVLGVASLYLGLFLLILLSSEVLIHPDVLENVLGTRVDFQQYLRLAWLASSLATIIGALGSGLDSSEAVRQAAYGYRPERQTEQDRKADLEEDRH